MLVSVSVADPGWSGLFIPDPDPDFLPIPDPGVKKAPDPGSGPATLVSVHIAICFISSHLYGIEHAIYIDWTLVSRLWCRYDTELDKNSIPIHFFRVEARSGIVAMEFRRPPRDVDRMTSLRVGNLPYRWDSNDSSTENTFTSVFKCKKS